MNVDPTMSTGITLLVGLLGGSGGVIAYLKLRREEKNDATTAYIDGHDKAAERYQRDLDGMSLRFEREIAELRGDLARVHDAVLALVELVPPDKVPQALAIVAALNRHNTVPIIPPGDKPNAER